MVDFLTHLYRRGTRPFRTLSSLPEAQVIPMMESLYVEGSIAWERFSDPAGYLSFRRQVEERLLADFRAKGGKPKDRCPIYMMLGKPKWFMELADPATLATTEEIRVPLTILDPREVSFTYPDSMVSVEIAEEKNPEYYESEYHGKVFTLAEIVKIVNERGMPGEGWETRIPKHLGHYIEAQVWNHAVLGEFLRQGARGQALVKP